MIKARGFSLIEILIVITLMSLIAVGIGVTVMKNFSRGQIGTARNQAYDVAKSFDQYRLEFGNYPSAAEGFQALVHPARGEPFLDRVPLDPWNNELIYVFPGVKNRGKPDIRSKGPDGVENTDDDVGNWPANE